MQHNHILEITLSTIITVYGFDHLFRCCLLYGCTWGVLGGIITMYSCIHPPPDGAVFIPAPVYPTNHNRTACVRYLIYPTRVRTLLLSLQAINAQSQTNLFQHPPPSTIYMPPPLLQHKHPSLALSLYLAIHTYSQ